MQSCDLTLSRCKGVFWRNNFGPVLQCVDPCLAGGERIWADFGPKIAHRNVVFARHIIIINWIRDH